MTRHGRPGAIRLRNPRLPQARRKIIRRRKQKKPLLLVANPAAVFSGLDINPGPPDEAHQRFLKADAPVSPPQIKSTDFLLKDELQDIQHVAVMPVNVDFSASAQIAVAGENQFIPDEGIDFIVYLPAGKPVERDRALGIYKQNEYALDKPHKQ